MKVCKYITSLCLLSSGTISYSQQASKDSIVTFKVFGGCEQCKHRIEEAVKGRGVKSANWNVDTKILYLSFNPSQTSLEKIQNRIIAVGHDLEDRKAKDIVYSELPDCCHYREMETMMNDAKTDTLQHKDSTSTEQTGNDQSLMEHTIKGVVLESDNKGVFKPLQGASVVWLGSDNGTTTDSSGVFKIKHDGNRTRLVVSFAGYQSDTITVTDMHEVKIILASGKQLKEVKVTAKQRSTYLSAVSPIRTEIMTDRELFKAACCNLSESFETNPSVDVSYNDAVTGSKQIQLLGLSGIYTQVTIENLPGLRGLATPLGLNSIS